ncbi:MAG: asparagine synthase, partial [Paenibacillus sp.]|nr:asparagine synthase [Paenibacillus sp.]
LDANYLRRLVSPESATMDLPWFGQLMSGPQLFAYIGQMDAWLREYNVSIR